VNIIRVFPRKTSMTPTDDYAFVGDPPLFRPDANEVHVSVTFTWDIDEGYRLRDAWSQYYPNVQLGGPAIDGADGKFQEGMYLKEGVTITSRGCIRKCPWCFVPEREGKIRLLDIKSGNVIQDNNILATPKEHQEKVYEMLKGQRKAAKFSGGIDARLVDDWVIDQFKQLRISEIFLAADTKGSLTSLAKAVEKLAFLGRDKLRCFVMIGYNEETIQEAEERLKEVWRAGCLPFAQLFQPPDKWIEYSKEWKDLNRNWSRPAITKTIMNAGG
jgi:hypothetical protein